VETCEELGRWFGVREFESGVVVDFWYYLKKND
jgi:hypothetical protein